MKVVILCGGKGTRLGDVTGNVIPKPMASVGGRPILWHIMRHYSRFGFNDFVLCAGHLSWEIKNYFLNYHARNADLKIRIGPNPDVRYLGGEASDDWTVTIAETGEETMTAGRVRRIAHYLDNDPFMLTYGDGVADVDLKSLLVFHKSHGKLATMTGVVAPGRFGELRLEGNSVAEWAEKPTVSDRFINGGFMVFERAFIERFIDLDGDDVMLERAPLMAATDAGELMLFRHTGFWQCMDTARDWTLLNDLWDRGQAPWK